MSISSQQARAERFQQLHARDAGRLLVLPNVWDAMSARLVEDAGADAVATTSAGVAWSRGYPDGQRITRDEMLAQVAVVVRAVRLPVTADMESGYGDGTPEDAATTARGVVEAGAVGLNLEDSPGREGAALVDAELHARRIAAVRQVAREAGVDLYVNARTDVFLRKVGEEATRFDEAVRRARLYLDAGASGIFLPFAPVELLQRLTQAIDAPVNVIAGPGSPTTPELRAMGVRRVSLATHLARSAAALVRRAAAEVLSAGTYGALEPLPATPDMNALFGAR